MAELTSGQVERFSKLFSGFKSRYGSFDIQPGQVGKQKGVAVTKPGPLFNIHWLEHLGGRNSVGIIPLMDDHQSAQFGCIDIDKYPMDFKALEKDCASLPVTITKSKSGGAHVWLFTLEPVPAKLIQDCLKMWAAALGFGKSEIFPKQILRHTPEDAGNWINLPYFGATRCAFFDGKEQTLDAFLDYAEKRRMNIPTLTHLMESMAKTDLFEDGPPCLATLTKKGIGPGTRNVFLLNVGTYFKKRDPGNFQTDLLEFNRKHMVDPLPESEIQNSIIKSLQRRSYGYQCQQEPLCSACNRTQCLKREFGIGGSSDELEITLTGLTKVTTVPPVWYINIDGVRVEMTDINQLINQNTFRTLAAETIHKLFPMIKRGAWEKVVNELLEHVEVLEAPEDSSFDGQMGNEIREFIAQYYQEDGMEQILAHTVFYDRQHGYAYFASGDLVKRLKKNLGTLASSQKAWAYLKKTPEFKVESVKQQVGNNMMILWRVSTQCIFIPDSPLSPPDSVKLERTEAPF